MSMFSVQGQILEVTVVGCSKLKNTEWISRQDPYVCLEYASTKCRTRTCTDGGKNATFQEKFVFTLIEGLREISIAVWNSNTLSLDAFIGSGKVQLHKVLAQGYDDSAWSLQDKKGRYAGDVRLIMYYANANKPTTSYPPSVPPAMPYGNSFAQQVPLVSAYPPTAYPPQVPPASATAYPPTSHPHSQAYPSYPVNITGYPHPPSYNQPAIYPPAYPPTSTYPPHSVYPPPPQGPPYHPPGSHPPLPGYPPYPY